MRRPVKNRNIPGKDLKYDSLRVEKFINSVMWDGKKSVARKVVYDAF
jgi:small subunit ribosomal protein S7